MLASHERILSFFRAVPILPSPDMSSTGVQYFYTCCKIRKSEWTSTNLHENFDCVDSFRCLYCCQCCFGYCCRDCLQFCRPDYYFYPTRNSAMNTPVSCQQTLFPRSTGHCACYTRLQQFSIRVNELPISASSKNFLWAFYISLLSHFLQLRKESFKLVHKLGHVPICTKSPGVQSGEVRHWDFCYNQLETLSQQIEQLYGLFYFGTAHMKCHVTECGDHYG